VDADASASDRPLFSVSLEALNDVVVWNPWVEKAQGMADFAPADGYKNMVCVEVGSVGGWQSLEKDETWEGGQVIRCRI
jgi:glucose-6-phosphate 1-epimerase